MRRSDKRKRSKLEQIAVQDTVPEPVGIPDLHLSLKNTEPQPPQSAVPISAEVQDTLTQVLYQVGIGLYEDAAIASLEGKCVSAIFDSYKQVPKKQQTPLRLYTEAVLKVAEERKDIDSYISIAVMLGRYKDAADFAERNGCIEAAIKVLEDSAKKNRPENSEFYLRAADIARHNGMEEEEKRLFMKFAECLKHNDRRMVAQAAEHFENAGHHERAMVMYEQLERPIDLYNAAKSAEKSDKARRATELYQKYVDKYSCSKIPGTVQTAAEICEDKLCQPEQARALYLRTIQLVERMSLNAPLVEHILKIARKLGAEERIAIYETMLQTGDYRMQALEEKRRETAVIPTPMLTHPLRRAYDSVAGMFRQVFKGEK